MGNENKNVVRVASTNKTTLAGEINEQMIGMEETTGYLGAKFPGGGMEYYAPEGADASFHSIIVGKTTPTLPAELVSKLYVDYKVSQSTADTVIYNGNGVHSGMKIVAGSTTTTFTIEPGVYNAIGIDGNVAYAGAVNQAVTNLTGNSTYLAINTGTGAIVQQSDHFTPTQRRTHVILGVLIHTDHININAINNLPDVATYTLAQLNDFLDAIGSFNEYGNIISANGANMSINKTIGSMAQRGINFSIEGINDPHTKTMGLLTAPANLRLRMSTGKETIDTDILNYGGYLSYESSPGVLSQITSGKYGTYRVVLFPSNLIRIQYPQVLYNSMAEAQAAISSEAYTTEANMAENGLLRGYIIVRGGTTNLNNTSYARFIEADRFGQFPAGATGSSTTTLQQAYLNSPTPEVETVNGAVSFKAGTNDNANVLEVLDFSGNITGFVTGDGDTNITPIKHNVMGFDDSEEAMQNKVTMVFNIGTSTFTLAPKTPYTYFDYFYEATRVKVTGTRTVQCPFATSRRWFILFNNTTGVLTAVTTATTYDLIRDNVFVAELYWNEAGTELIIDEFEAHGSSMGSAEHYYNHMNSRTRYTSGLLVSPVNGTTNVSVSSGAIADEDIPWSISSLSSGASIQTLYRNGTTWNGSFFLAGVATSTGSAVYNLNTGGSYSLATVAANQFCCVHYYARLSFRGNNIFTITGQEVYGSISAARAGAQTELSNLVTNGLPMSEFKALGTAIIDGAAGSWTFVPVDGGTSMLIDWRTSTVGSIVPSTPSLAQVLIEGNDAGAKKITGLADGSTTTDAATVNQVFTSVPAAGVPVKSGNSYGDSGVVVAAGVGGSEWKQSGSAAYIKWTSPNIVINKPLEQELDGTTANHTVRKSQMDTAIATAITNGMDYKGAYNASTNSPDLDTAPITGIKVGDTYTVTIAGDFFTIAVEAGDTLIAKQDTPVLEQHWAVVQANMTPNSILSAIKTVDGTGSGLDADTLDGVEYSTINSNISNKLDKTTASAQSVASAVSFAGTIDALQADVIAPVGTQATLNFRNNTSGTGIRWQVQKNSDPESTGNLGSNFKIRAWSDTGVWIDDPVTIARAAGGIINMTRPLANTGQIKSTKSGSGSDASAINITSNDPTIFINDTNAAADEKIWEARIAGGDYIFRGLNDAETVASTAYIIGRTGGTVDNFNILISTASTTTTTGALTVGGGVGVVGALNVGGVAASSATNANIDSKGATALTTVGWYKANKPTLGKTATILLPVNGDGVTMFRTDVAITVQEVNAVCTGTTPSVAYIIYQATSRGSYNPSVVSATCTSITTGNQATISNASIPANSWVWIEVGTCSGTINSVAIDLRYTED